MDMMDFVLSNEQIHDLAVGFHEMILLYVKEQAEQENLSADCCVMGEGDKNIAFPNPEAIASNRSKMSKFFNETEVPSGGIL